MSFRVISSIVGVVIGRFGFVVVVVVGALTYNTRTKRKTLVDARSVIRSPHRAGRIASRVISPRLSCAIIMDIFAPLVSLVFHESARGSTLGDSSFRARVPWRILK